ncbi:MAG: TetR family transcriptional regulator C-terminal domain-containing protein [Pseudomonadota bacterium]
MLNKAPGVKGGSNMVRMSRDDRRKQLLDAAIEAILEKGVAQASTRDVTRALGVGSGLLHHYFSSWADLRAEAVGLAARREIDELHRLIAEKPALEALDDLADWMVQDEEMRHWRLWLNAQDEAHRDDRLADVMNVAIAEWRALIASLLARAFEGADLHAADVDGAAWRLAAVIDGLAGPMLVRRATTSPKVARALIEAQIKLEIDGLSVHCN